MVVRLARLLPVGQQTLPLDFDALTYLTILFANSPPLQKTFGALDATGRAVATFDGSYLPPQADLMTFWFAAVVFGPSGFFVTNAEDVKIDFNG